MHVHCHVRPGRPADVPALAALARSGVNDPWSEASFREAVETDWSFLLVADGDGDDGIAGYLVTESLILDDRARRPVGERSHGFSLIGFLQRPPRLSEDEWLRIWLGSHTDVAVGTQSTFRYVQNVVARTLTPDAPPLDALVEEGFPTAALDSPQAFYDAVGDDARYQRHLDRMMTSCHRFIDFDRIDSLPTSEYPIRALD